MSYNIKKINPENLKKLYIVLNDIYSEFIISDDYKDIYYHPSKSEEVTLEEQKETIAWLIRDQVLKGHRDKDGYILEITQDFFNLYGDVKEKIEEDTKPTFDEEKSILSFSKYKIQIAKQNKKTLAHEIISYIFNNSIENPTFYSEMADELAGQEDYHKEVKIGKKYYNVCQEIQNKIKEQTKEEISDFLVFNMSEQGEVKINSKYL